MQRRSPSSGGRPLTACRWWPAALALAALVCGGADSEAWLEAATSVTKLGAPSDSALIASGFPAADSSVYLSFSYSEPGSLLDTVGINAASDGDWALRVEGDSTLMLSLYTRSGGWQRIILASRVEPGREYHAVLKVKAGILSSEVYVGEQLLNGLSARLAVPPSASPVYAGDFPGDNGWGSGYNIHQGIVGQVALHYLGPWIDELTPETIRGSIVKPAAGPASDKSSAPGPDGNSDASLELQVADVPAARTPEDAVRLILEAQIRGDVPAMLGYTYLQQSPPEARLATQALMRVVAQKLVFSALDLELGGTAYGQQGNLALVRCRHAVFVEGGGVAAQEAFGSLVLLRKTPQGWKVVQFMADDLLNVGHESAAGAAGSASIKVAYALPAAEGIYGTAAQDQDAESSPIPGMLDYAKLSRRFGAAIQGWQFDEERVFIDETFSVYGWCPFYGDIVSSGYTAVQSVRTIYNELLPDLAALDLELVGYDITQVAVGVLQILSEPIPGLDVAADNLGVAVDNWKYNVTQSRHFSRLRLALAFANLEGLKKYLFLRPAPIHTDPEHGIKSGMQVNVAFESYSEWSGKQEALRQITLLSDLPLRYWKHLDFDIGFQFTILRSESEALYDAAVALGLRGESHAGLAPEHSVVVPVRLGTVQRHRLIDGEFDPLQLAKNPRQEATPKLTIKGVDILQNPRIVCGEQTTDRFIRLDISPMAGPNQTIQVNLLTGENDKTEPLTIENAVYNNLSGVQAMDDQGMPILSEDPTINITIGEMTELNILGANPTCPWPRVIGAPVSDWSVDAPLVCEMEVLGAFPDAKLRLTGRSAGLTYLRYTLATGDQVAQKSIDGVLMVRVLEGGYRLEGMEIAGETPDLGSTSFEVNDGLVTGSNISGPATSEVAVAGSAQWTSPPRIIADETAVWQFSCTLAVELVAGDRGAAEYSTSQIKLLAPGLTGVDSLDFAVRLGEGGSLHASKSIPLKGYLMDETEDAPAYKPTGRKRLNLWVNTPGGETYIAYIYLPVQ